MILDTNAVSAFFDGVPEVVSEVERAVSLFIPVVVIGEYLYGLLSSRERAEREVRFRGFCASCQTLRIDEDTAEYYSSVRHRLRLAGKPIPDNDIWIAALARQYGQQILSNDRHFDVVDDVSRTGW